MVPDPGLKASVAQKLERLSEEERTVIKLEHGLDDGVLRNPEEVAHLLGSSLIAVEEIRARAWAKLSEPDGTTQK